MPSKDPDKIREKNRRYREANRDELNAKARAKAATPEGRAAMREYQRRWDEKNPGRRAEYLREYRAAHRPEPKFPKGPIGGPDDPRHGTTGGYGNHKCRCDRCREAWNSHMREYKARRKREAEKG